MPWKVEMLKSVHLVGEDENDDLYADFEQEYNPAFDTEELYEDEGFQQALKSSYGKRPGPGTSAGRPPGTGFQRMGTAAGRGKLLSSMGRPTTGIAADAAQARPMTAVRAAGYSSIGGRAPTGQFDPLNQARGPAPPLEAKNEDSPEEKVKMLEKQVMELIEESCFAAERNDVLMALEKAKEAGRKERNLVRQREQSQTSEQMNLDITYSVLFNLALSYHRQQLFNEATNTYNVIVKNKMFNNAGRLRVNIGNTFYEQGKYSHAVKFYRMALDQIPNTHKDIRFKIMKSIAMVFVKMGQYSDAITTYEHIMSDKPDVETVGDKDKMKKTFQKLVQIETGCEDSEKYTAAPDDHHSQLILEVIRDDPLRRLEKKQQALAEKCIMVSAKLIAPVIEANFDDGFDWCVEIVKSSPYVELANELEITRSIAYLKIKDFTKATETLKKFEKKDTKMQSQAAVNLSFLYFLEGELANADKHADIAVNADRYNPAALVNKGDVLFQNGDFHKAKEFYIEALNIETSCTEALYNLEIKKKSNNEIAILENIIRQIQWLCYKKLMKYEDALECFHKLHLMLPSNGEVICQLGAVYELLKNNTEALEWYHQLLNLTPSDPGILKKIAVLYEQEDDSSQAFQYMYESYRYYPSCIDTLSWLGTYYIEAQFIEKAVTYFERAVQVQPTDVKWHLMLATTCRRSGNYIRAMETYKEVHERFPENLECLKFLIRLCHDQGLIDESNEYTQKLNKTQKMLELKEQRTLSGTRRSSGRGNRSSAALEESPVAEKKKETFSLDNDNTTFGLPDRLGSGRSKKNVVDASYNDPLGDAPSRPKTSGGRNIKTEEIDEFADDDIGDDLLPD